MLPMILLAAAMAVSPPRAQEMACQTRATQAQLAERSSPLDSVSFTVGSVRVKVCYGRPSARGRTIFGSELVPFGQLWRTGANEPTMIHASGPLRIAGLAMPAGVVSLYTVPGPTEWEIILNRSVRQWGAERGYTDEIKAQEIGRAKATPETLKNQVEQFTIRSVNEGGRTRLLLEWETTRVAIPIDPGT